MKIRKRVAVFSGLLMACAVFEVPAKADTILTLIANDTFSDGAILAGTVQLDNTTGVFVSSALTIGAPDSLLLDEVSGAPVCLGSVCSQTFSDAAGDVFSTYITNSLSNDSLLYGNGPLTIDGSVALASGGYLDANGGTLVATATPEPSTFLTLTGGLILLSVVGYRRLTQWS